MAERVGQRLGNYRLIRLIGKGGFAEVYLGEHLRLNTQAAIKVLHTHLASEDEIDAFQKEAQTIAHLVHPHIVRVLDFDVQEDTPFLVMDYAPNGTLRQRHPKGAVLAPRDILPYVKQAADGLQYAHDKRLIHRDIKPENFLLGEHHQVLLSDFGIALIAQSSRHQNTQEVVGTMAYMAPEQLQGHPRPASDQYSLAITVYEWLTGERPFHGSFSEIFSQQMFVQPVPLRAKAPTVSSAVEEVVMTALAKDPKQRFGSLRAFANAFEQACQTETPAAVPTQFARPSGLLSQPPAALTGALTPPQAAPPSAVLTPPVSHTPSSAQGTSGATPAPALFSTVAMPLERQPSGAASASTPTPPSGQSSTPSPPAFSPTVRAARPPAAASTVEMFTPPQPAASPSQPRHMRRNLLLSGVAFALLVAVTIGVLTHNAAQSTGFQQQVTTGPHITSIQLGTGVDPESGSVQGATDTFHTGDMVYVVFTVSNGGLENTFNIRLYDNANDVVYSDMYSSAERAAQFNSATVVTQAGIYKWEIDYNGTSEASITFQVVS